MAQIKIQAMRINSVQESSKSELSLITFDHFKVSNATEIQGVIFSDAALDTRVDPYPPVQN